MRVVGGKWKSRKLNSFLKFSTNSVIRPTTDRVKENIFNILETIKTGNPIVGAKVLDIFCGTGSMGIEAISRGASFCHFVDQSLISKKITEKNIQKLSCQEETRFTLKDVLEIGHCDHDRADIVFLDPPYKKRIAEKSIQKLFQLSWIDEKTLLILEKGKDELFKSDFRLFDKRNYGNTEILFLKF